MKWKTFFFLFYEDCVYIGTVLLTSGSQGMAYEKESGTYYIIWGRYRALL